MRNEQQDVEVSIERFYRRLNSNMKSCKFCHVTSEELSRWDIFGFKTFTILDAQFMIPIERVHCEL